MMKILKYLSIFVLIVLLFIVHLGAIYVLPHPWNTLNTTIVVISLLIIGWENGFVVWVAMFFYYIVELYSVSFFGLVLFSATTATLFTFWIYQSTFEKRTWFSGFGVSFILVIIFRGIYSILFLLFTFYDTGTILWKSFLFPYMWEIVLTPIVTGLIFIALNKTTTTFESIHELKY